MQISDYSGKILPEDIEEADRYISGIFASDVLFRKRNVRTQKYECKIFYLDGMTNSELINESIVKPIIQSETLKNGIDSLSDEVLYACEISKTDNVADMLRGILYGDTLIILGGSRKALIANSKGWPRRAVSEPENEKILTGPREGFGESALANVSMIRRKLLTPDLCVEQLRIGRRSDTRVLICYLHSLADEKTVEELKRRLKNINIDGILDSNYLTELTRERPNSLFKTSGTTERPDVAAARLLEGRIAIVTDGTPSVATVPYLFSENFQSDEDYYVNWLLSSVGRFLRYLSFFIAISAPAVFIALTTFHESLLPTSLAISIAEARSGVPFSSILECILIIILFKILTETGMRMPSNLGTALSIVGGIVIGQSAVEAKIVSATMLIVVSLSGIAGLMVPRLSAAVFYFRIILVITCYFFGIFGYFAAGYLILSHIFSLKSYSADCTAALDNISLQNFKDTVIRAPWKRMKLRPQFNLNKIRKL